DGVIANVERAGCGSFLAALSYGGMPYDIARENQRLFAEKVLPRLKAHDTGVEIGAAPPLAAAAE
ncbi:MAG: LLM class flavin-dependent oxidoreductase, partial [Alphaproteobacteria bacterium]|nr:LLM class flavin-dependent oxidoreductase [Alphaproteobacteria bacterium]